MKSHRILSILACGLIIQLLYGTVVRGDKPASDDAKKEAVYRMYAGYKEEFPEVMDISARQAMALQDRGEAVFVDTRKPEEMAVSALRAPFPSRISWTIAIGTRIKRLSPIAPSVIAAAYSPVIGPPRGLSSSICKGASWPGFWKAAWSTTLRASPLAAFMFTAKNGTTLRKVTKA